MANCCLFDSEDMIVEIFSRLPVKSLLRFMSVSKSYSFLICSPQFIRIQTLRSPSKIFVSFLENVSLYGRCEVYLYTLLAEHQLALRGEIGDEYPFHYIRLISSCNGILFLETRGFRVAEFVLWNPCLGCKLTLPRISPSMRVFGFGYDPITDDYKVLRMSYDLADPMVYSVKTGAWLAIPPPTNHYARINSYFSCFVNGAMHWLVSNLKRHSIMTFDVSGQVFGEIALPDEIRDCRNLKLITIRESLGVVARVMKEWEVWMMGEYKNASTWSRVYKFKFKYWYVELRGCFETNGEIFMLFRSMHDDWQFRIINAVTGERSKLMDLGVDHYNIRVDEVQTFKESLALLNRGLRYQGS